MKIKKLLKIGIPAGIVIFFILFAISLFGIYSDVAKVCEEVIQKYSREKCVDALLAYVQDENRTFKERNHGLWALAQLGDKKSIPTLEELKKNAYTSTPCDTSLHICTYSIEKAIKFSKGFTITKWMYKNL